MSDKNSNPVQDHAFWNEIFHHAQTSVRLLERYHSELNPKNLEADKIHIHSEIQHLARLMETATGFLRTGKSEAWHWEKVEMHKFVQKNCSEIVPEEAKKNFSLQIEPTMCLAHIAPAQIEEVLRIILDNAWKYATQESKIEVKSQRCEENKYHLYIKNEGSSIPQDQLQNILKPHVRLHKDQPGSGLGLALASHIMQLHQGQINIQSNGENWVEVEMTFPCLDLQH